MKCLIWKTMHLVQILWRDGLVEIGVGPCEKNEDKDEVLEF